MPISTADSFQKRHVTREDGIEVLPRALIGVAAMESGYCLDSPAINEAMKSVMYPGQMTSEEFVDFCEKHKEDFMSAEDMAKAVVVVAPTNVITRGSLEEILKKSSSKKDTLSEEEIDALFTTLDTENKGAISAEDFMRALYGDEGAFRLAERRKLDSDEARRRKEKEEKEAAERAAREKAAKEAAEKKAKEEDGKKEQEKKQKAKSCC